MGSIARFFSNSGDDLTDNELGTKALELQERKTLAAEESRAVKVWRVIVYAAVLIAAVGVSLGVYFYTKNDQQEDFESNYRAYAGIVTESFFDSVERKMGALGSFSTTITSYASE